MSVISFIKTKTFVKHFLLAVLSALLLFWIVFKIAGSYTMHGETVTVPNFSGVKLAELDNFTSGKEIKYVVIDSLYDLKQPPGVVVKQDPEPNSQVKNNRTIYLYVTSQTPPQVEMPKLVDRSVRQAVAMIETYGLKVGKTEFKPDQCSNCVLEQLVKGKRIEPGTTIPKGTVIDLVVGKGLTSQYVAIPYLIGMTRGQALEKLTEASLKEGAINFDGKVDSLKARVYRQSPSYSKNKTVSLGSGIDIFYTTDASKIPLVPDTLDTN